MKPIQGPVPKIQPLLGTMCQDGLVSTIQTVSHISEHPSSLLRTHFRYRHGFCLAGSGANLAQGALPSSDGVGTWEHGVLDVVGVLQIRSLLGIYVEV